MSSGASLATSRTATTVASAGRSHAAARMARYSSVGVDDVFEDNADDIPPDAAAAAAAALLCRVGRNDASLVRLSLNGVSLGDAGANRLGDALRRNSCLKMLDAGKNGIGARGAEGLARALEGRHRRDDGDGNDTIDLDDYECGLEVLLLRDNAVRARGAASLARALGGAAPTTKLAWLSLGRNAIGEKGAPPLAEMLRTNVALERLWLYGNDLRDEGARALAGALAADGAALRELYLGSNGVGDEGAEALGRALACNRALVKLELYSNRITNVGAGSLAEGLKRNDVLVELDVRKNEIKLEGCQRLVDALKESRRLQLLDVRENDLDEGAMTQLEQRAVRARAVLIWPNQKTPTANMAGATASAAGAAASARRPNIATQQQAISPYDGGSTHFTAAKLVPQKSQGNIRRRRSKPATSTAMRGSIIEYEQFGYPSHRDSTTAWAVYGNRYDSSTSGLDRAIGVVVLLLQIVTYVLIILQALGNIGDEFVPVVISRSSCRAQGASIQVEEVTLTPAPTSSKSPSEAPSGVPSVAPSGVPSVAPSRVPTSAPSSSPTSAPSTVPTEVPSSVPTSAPSSVPTSMPSSAPTRVLTAAPTPQLTRRIPASALTLRPTWGWDDDGIPGLPLEGQPSQAPRPTPQASSDPSPMPTHRESLTEPVDDSGNEWTIWGGEGAESTTTNNQTIIVDNTKHTKITTAPLQCEAKTAPILGWIFASTIISIFLAKDFQDAYRAVRRSFRVARRRCPGGGTTGCGGGGGGVDMPAFALLAYLEVVMSFAASVTAASSKVYMGELVDGIETSVGILFAHDLGGRVYMSLVGDKGKTYRRFFLHFFSLLVLSCVGGILVSIYIDGGF